MTQDSGAAEPRFGRMAGLLALPMVLGIGWMAGLQPLPVRPSATKLGPAPATAVAPPPATPDSGTPCTMEPAGFLRGRVFGAVSASIDWAGAGLLCDGMPRPDDAGVRLFFAGDQERGGRLVFVIGIDGAPAALVGAERPANVTVIDEPTGRFFSSGGTGRCWADVDRVSVAANDRAIDGRLRIDGTLYCAGALPALNDRSSLTLGDLRFAGRFATVAPSR